jgi:hypothetical protein
MKGIDLVELARQHGQSNLRFFVPLREQKRITVGWFSHVVTGSSEDAAVVECVVDCEGRYPAIIGSSGFGYKVSIKPLNSAYESADFYIRDLELILEARPERADGRGVRFLGTDIH